MSDWIRSHHPVCPCGHELADECMCPHGNPLGSMRIEAPIGSYTPRSPEESSDDRS